MFLNLRLSLILVSIALAIVTTVVLRNGRIPIKYSLLWYLSSVVIFLVAVFPVVIETISKFLGFATLSNLVIGVLIVILLFLTMSLTIITSGQKKKITLLIQEVSALKQKVNKK